MKRTYLDVPYDAKELAKSLGARWDNDKKKWYAEPGTTVAAVLAWLPIAKSDERRIQGHLVGDEGVVLGEPKIIVTLEGAGSSCVGPYNPWEHLPPRSADIKVLLKIIGGQPYYRKRFFCGMCDSNAGDDWCVAGASPIPNPNCNCDQGTLRSYADSRIGILRPTELRLLLQALNTNRN